MDRYEAGYERYNRPGFRSTSGAILNGESIHARRAMSVEMPSSYEVIHGADLDTGLD